MATLEQVVRSCRVERVELTRWIEQRWVRPQETTAGYSFDEVDEARVTLIRELREELLVSDETLDVVLSLLDQLYATRRMLRTVEDAIEALPAPLRDEVEARLRGTPEG